MWRNGVRTTLLGDGGLQAVARGVNNRGIVVGTMERVPGDPLTWVAAAWNQRMPIALPTPAGWTGAAIAINQKNVVVGLLTRATPSVEWRAVVWNPRRGPAQ